MSESRIETVDAHGDDEYKVQSDQVDPKYPTSHGHPWETCYFYVQKGIDERTVWKEAYNKVAEAVKTEPLQSKLKEFEGRHKAEGNPKSEDDRRDALWYYLRDLFEQPNLPDYVGAVRKAVKEGLEVKGFGDLMGLSEEMKKNEELAWTFKMTLLLVAGTWER